MPEGASGPSFAGRKGFFTVTALLREAAYKLRRRVLQRFPWVKPIAKRILRRGGDVSVRGAVTANDSLVQRVASLVADPYKEYVRVETLAREQNRDLYRERLAAFAHKPVFSIVIPVYNTPGDLLQKCLDSVLRQLYPHWELCIVDDASTQGRIGAVLKEYAGRDERVRVHTREKNGHISAATNDGIAMARGQYIALLDHDDELTEDALYFLAERINEFPDADVLYTDQDKLSEGGERYEPFFKPDWSPAYLRGVMYLGHLLAVRTELVRAVGGCDGAFNGVQDFELALRVTEKARRVEHIARICYHWRAIEGSIATSVDAKPDIAALQQRAVQKQLDRLGLVASAMPQNDRHRLKVVPNERPEGPLVSILICTKDAGELISRCLDSLFAITRYRNFEVVIADNGTTDPVALAAMERHPVRRLEMPGKFHFAAYNNRLAREARGQYLLFLNNDTEILDPLWLEQMLHHAAQKDVGAVGPMLLFPDRTVQHAGVILGPRGTADHVMRNFPEHVEGYAGSLWCDREVSAVTAACLLVSAEKFHAVGGFNERFRNHYEDVDLNLKLRKGGYRNVYVGATRLVHHESKSRGKFYDYNDRVLLLDLWEHWIDRGDPYYNRNFHREHFDYTLWTGELQK